MWTERCSYCGGMKQVACDCTGDCGPSEANGSCPGCGGNGKHICPACNGKGVVEEEN